MPPGPVSPTGPASLRPRKISVTILKESRVELESIVGSLEEGVGLAYVEGGDDDDLACLFHPFNHRLKIAVTRDQDGLIVIVHEGIGQHVRGQLGVHSLLDVCSCSGHQPSQLDRQVWSAVERLEKSLLVSIPLRFGFLVVGRIVIKRPDKLM